MELSSYTRAPERPVELDEFERVGILRLRVLCALSAWSHGGSLRHEVETLDAFQELFGANGEHTVDTISHYALRLAFCKYVTSMHDATGGMCCCTGVHCW